MFSGLLILRLNIFHKSGKSLTTWPFHLGPIQPFLCTSIKVRDVSLQLTYSSIGTLRAQLITRKDLLCGCDNWSPTTNECWPAMRWSCFSRESAMWGKEDERSHLLDNFSIDVWSNHSFERDFQTKVSIMEIYMRRRTFPLDQSPDWKEVADCALSRWLSPWKRCWSLCFCWTWLWWPL